jgi:hypothetical protein
LHPEPFRTFADALPNALYILSFRNEANPHTEAKLAGMAWMQGFCYRNLQFFLLKKNSNHFPQN